jgi:hypothetical protein
VPVFKVSLNFKRSILVDLVKYVILLPSSFDFITF